MRSRTGRSARLLGAALLVAGAAVALAAPASAESINDISVDVQVSPDTSFQVTETIAYDFGSASKHGIFRDIPVSDVQQDGRTRHYRVSIDSVTMDGGSEPVTITDQGDLYDLKIGDPNTLLTGQHTYEIVYTVQDGLRSMTQEDVANATQPNLTVGDVELFWDFVGTGWDVPISNATVTVNGPAAAVGETCFSGAFGSTQTCPTASTAGVVTLGPTSLAPHSALTGAIAWPASAFDRTPTEVYSAKPLNPWLGAAIGLVPALLLLFIPMWFAIAHRRRDAGAPIPGAPPQYSPPDDLAPAALYAAWKGAGGEGESQVLLATLLDLARRRWLNVSSNNGSLQIDWLGTGTTPLTPWEEGLLSAVMKGQSTAVLSGYDKGVASQWAFAYTGLVAEQEAAGRRNADGDAPDRRWRWILIVGIVAMVLMAATYFFGSSFFGAMLLVIGLTSLLSFGVARAITPRNETQQSATLIAKIDGFRKVLGTDPAASRREFAQRSGLTPAAIFATMLPYAVIFGLESSWLGAFPDLTPDDFAATGFYIGTWGMSGLLNSGTTSMSSAMSAPSSSGGSGFSGGFSGGGGGGGGGGSW